MIRRFLISAILLGLCAMLPAQNVLEGHEYVDLGLTTTDGKPIYWATCNVGAEQPEESGMSFFWGDAMGFRNEYTALFDWISYKWYDSSTNELTKYCTDIEFGQVDNKKVLDPEDDGAYVKWGGTWRMPTEAEMKSLIKKCKWTWGELNGVNGYAVTGKNGNSIFLPAAGYRTSVYQYNVNQTGGYWTASLCAKTSTDNAYYLFFVESNNFVMGIERCVGFPIRAVCVIE